MLARILKDHGLLSLLLTGTASIVLILLQATAEGSAMVADSLSMHWAFGWCSRSPIVTQMACGTMLLLSGFVTREAGIRFRLLSTKGWMPVLATVCIGLLYGHALLRPDILVGALISQLIVVLILSTYRKDSVLTSLFHVGMLTGVAVLFHGPSVLMLAVVLFSIFILRPGAWREWLMPFMGLMMLLVFVMLVLVWRPVPFEALRTTLLSAWVLSVSGPQPHVGHVVMLVLLGLALPTMLQDIASGAVQTRNGMLVMLSLIIVAVVMALFLPVGLTAAPAWAAFPLAITVSVLIERAVRWWWADLLVLALIAAVLLGHLP
ncbi:MAG: hypothetical protein K9J06_05530 [Flavobacteriales bacterium]|nr:hypothetical protein [Flavobacteriales bacterium]